MSRRSAAREAVCPPPAPPIEPARPAGNTLSIAGPTPPLPLIAPPDKGAQGGGAITDAAKRSPQEVFEDHLRAGRQGCAENELRRNFAEDVVLLTGRGVFRGRDGMRHLARRLREELPEARFEYRTRLVEGEIAFLEWTAVSADGSRIVEDGADSYLIREGRIIAQTIHYTVRQRSPDSRPHEVARLCFHIATPIGGDNAAQAIASAIRSVDPAAVVELDPGRGEV